MASLVAGRRFAKMHGAGNDFVVLDLRAGQPAPDIGLCRLLADRRRGVGCDQVLTVESALSPGAVAAYRVWNADGSPSRQCGNGARCVAHYLRRDGSAPDMPFALDSPAGPIEVEPLPNGHYRLTMGRPEFDPEAIGLRLPGPADAYSLNLDGAPVRFGAVSMGNPHAVLEVADLDSTPVERLGRALQARSEFTDSVNVGFAQAITPTRIRLRVYERGVGETPACGSGACAAAAVLMRRGLIESRVTVEMPGGSLLIEWPGGDQTIRMSGPAAFVFEGELAAPSVETRTPHAHGPTRQEPRTA